MSITTWLDATIANIVPMGTVQHHVSTTTTGQRSVITWVFESRSVLLGESEMLGRKRAMYHVLNNPRVIAMLRKLESDAERIIAKRDADDAAYLRATALDLGIDLDDNDGEWMPSAEDERMAALATQG